MIRPARAPEPCHGGRWPRSTPRHPPGGKRWDWAPSSISPSITRRGLGKEQGSMSTKDRDFRRRPDPGQLDLDFPRAANGERRPGMSRRMHCARRRRRAWAHYEARVDAGVESASSVAELMTESLNLAMACAARAETVALLRSEQPRRNLFSRAVADIVALVRGSGRRRARRCAVDSEGRSRSTRLDRHRHATSRRSSTRASSVIEKPDPAHLPHALDSSKVGDAPAVHVVIRGLPTCRRTRAGWRAIWYGRPPPAPQVSRSRVAFAHEPPPCRAALRVRVH